jgi:hypothetical protein
VGLQSLMFHVRGDTYRMQMCCQEKNTDECNSINEVFLLFLFLFVVLGIEPRASCMVAKSSANELQLSPQ